MSKEKWISSEEHMALLRQNPEWVARHNAQEAERKRREEEFDREEAPLRLELKERGIHVHSVWDFVNTAEKYPAAIPVLLRHMSLPHSERIKEGIVRALTVNYAGPDVLAELIRQFRNETDDRPNSLKWVLGNAISEVATPADAETIISLALDPSHGRSRDAITQRLPRVVKDKSRLRQVLQLLQRDEQTKSPAELASRGKLY